MSEIITAATVTGQVIDNASDTGLAGVSVEAWDNTNTYTQALATATTDANGRFTLRIDPKTANMQAVPDLYFKVFDANGGPLSNTADQVTWNTQLQESVTLYIVTADATQPVDAYNALQLTAMTDFFGQSDFKGVVTQAAGVGGSSLGFVKDMLTNTFTNFQQAPLKVAAGRSDVIGQDAKAATTTLLNQQVTVNQVLPYAPSLNKTCLSLLASQPLSLKAGQSVNLYQQNGVVKFYTLAAGAATSSCSPDQYSAKPVESAAAAGSAGPAAAVGARVAVVGAAASSKDAQIAQLQQQLATLQKAQDDLKAYIQSKLPG